MPERLTQVEQALDRVLDLRGKQLTGDLQSDHHQRVSEQALR